MKKDAKLKAWIATTWISSWCERAGSAHCRRCSPPPPPPPPPPPSSLLFSHLFYLSRAISLI